MSIVMFDSISKIEKNQKSKITDLKIK